MPSLERDDKYYYYTNSEDKKMRALKKILAVAGMAAMITAAVPTGNAQAANTCTHDYHKYCLGFYSYTVNIHEYKYYTFNIFGLPQRHVGTCEYKEVLHGDSTKCANCGALVAGIGTHHGSTIHVKCSGTKHYCSGTGSDVTGLY